MSDGGCGSYDGEDVDESDYHDDWMPRGGRSNGSMPSKARFRARARAPGLGTKWSAWKAEAAVARDRKLERLRQVGFVFLAAFVLLPARLVVLFTLGLGVVYMGIAAVRSICIRKRGVA